MSQFICENTSTEEPKALRLCFSYEGENIELIHQAVVETTAHKFHIVEGRLGHFVDCHDENGELLDRRFIYRGFETHVEIWTPDGFTRELIQEARGAFSLLVPYSDALDHVRITHIAREHPVMPDIERGMHASPVIERELARFKVAK